MRLFRPANPDEFDTAERCSITELMNDAGVPDVSLARARVAPGVTTQLHALDVREVYVVMAGTGRVDDGSGIGFDVGPGDCVDIPAGTPQRITNTGSGDLVFLCVCAPRFRAEGYRNLEGG